MAEFRPRNSAGGVLNYLEHHGSCSKKVAEGLVAANAWVYGIEVTMVPSETEQDWQAIQALTGGEVPAAETEALSPPSDTVWLAVPQDASVVFQARFVGDPQDYAGFADRLQRLRQTVTDLSGRLN
jgi:hypothetical protein